MTRCVVDEGGQENNVCGIWILQPEYSSGHGLNRGAFSIDERFLTIGFVERYPVLYFI